MAVTSGSDVPRAVAAARPLPPIPLTAQWFCHPSWAGAANLERVQGIYLVTPPKKRPIPTTPIHLPDFD